MMNSDTLSHFSFTQSCLLSATRIYKSVPFSRFLRGTMAMSSMASEISAKDVKIANIVLGTCAIALTALRLFYRARMKKLWWDDAWAFLGLLSLIVYLVAVLLFIKGTETLPRSAKVGIYYMCDQFTYAVVWSARVSILFTIIRITPNGPTRTFLGYMVMAFILCWAILFAQVWWVCERQPGWKDAFTPQCALGEDVAIAQVITDVICDAILISAPIRLIQGVKLSMARKIQLISVFSTTSVTTAVSLYHAFAILKVGGLYEAFAASIEVSMSLIIANLTVIVAIFRRMWHSDDEKDNNRRALFHTISFHRRARQADPLRTLTTIGGVTTINIETIVESDATKTLTSSIEAPTKSTLLSDDEHVCKGQTFTTPMVYELNDLKRAEPSSASLVK